MPPIFQNVELAAFRGLRDLRLEKCAGINLLVGPNNSGKTTVLEALALLCRPVDLPWWINVVWPREIKAARTPVQEVVKLLFPHQPTVQAVGEGPLFAGSLRLCAMRKDFGPWVMDATWQEKRVAIKDLLYYKVLRGDGLRNTPPLESGSSTSLAADFTAALVEGNRGQRIIFYEFSEDGALPYGEPTPEHFIPCAYVTTVAHRTDNLTDRLAAILLHDQREMLTELLHQLQPSLQTFEVVPRAGQSPGIYLRDEVAGWLPLSAAGDGMRRVFYYATAMVEARGGVLLIDEIESALHTSALRRVFGFLVQQCRELDVQLFATTHSLEALDAMLEESRAVHDDIAAFVLGREPGVVRRVDGPRLHTLREEHGFDIR